MTRSSSCSRSMLTLQSAAVDRHQLPMPAAAVVAVAA